jgi:hypothetical protein
MANSGSKKDIYFRSIAIKPPSSTDTPEPEFVELPLSLGGTDASLFGGMEISESIFQGGLKGFIILNDIGPVSDLAKNGSLIRFSFATNNPDSDDLSTGLQSVVRNLQFYVHNVSIVSNVAPGVIRHGGSSQDVSYRLEFASFESTSLQFEELPIFEDDWVGTISDFITIQLNKYFSSVEDVGDKSTVLSKNTSQIEPGNHNVVPTYNGIWWKKNQSLYPWGKEKKIPNLNTLFHASTNYAVPDVIDAGDLGDVPGSDENLGGFGGGLDIPDGDLEFDGRIPLRGSPDEKNPSYVFYQSMPDGKWNFTPIGGSKGLYGKRYVEGLGYHEYQLTNDETVQARIENFTISSLGDLLELQHNGAFACHYDLIEPNWAGVYNNLTESGCANPADEGSVGEEETTTLNSYDQSIIGQRQTAYYHDFMSLSTHLLHDRVEFRYSDFFDVDDDGEVIGIGPLLGGQLVSDGLEDPGSSSIRDTVYGYFDSRYLNKPYPTENDDYSSGRGQKYMWQTMFDVCDLPLYNNDQTGEIGIHYLVNQYRKPCKKAIFAYTVLADIKEQWNRYRHTICCDGSGRDKFMALLVGYTGGYKADSDGQVIQNRDVVPFGLSGGTGPDNTYHYSFVEVEIWPKILIPQGISAADVIPNFEDGTVEYFDYLESIDLNTATGPNYTKQIFLPDYAGGTGGITFDFGLNKANDSEQEYKIHQDQEFFVIPVGGGRRGLFNAYNVVELMNNKAFTNVGVNKLGYNYPSGFSLSPIGGMTSGITDETTPINPTYMGSIVEMQSLKESDLLEIQTEQDMIDSGVGGYTGPSLEGTTCEKVVGLLNLVTGTDNVPRIFGGSTFDISYSVSGEYINIERDDKESRTCIADVASPQGVGSESGAAGSLTGITASPVVYLFYSENDHDGKCSSE